MKKIFNLMKICLPALTFGIALFTVLVLIGSYFAYIKNLKNEIKALKANKTFFITVTKYTNDPKETDDTPNTTASNKKVKEGYIAVSDDMFNLGWTFGRKVYIEGLGIFEIQDRMNKRHHYTMDIFSFKKKDAIAFGTQKRWAYLIVNESE